MAPGFSFHIPQERTDDENWLPHWPNPADLRFNYYKLLQSAPHGLGRLPGRKSVAVIGAGAAGMAAARELDRCGLRVVIFEASDRIGGRLYTRDSPVGPSGEGVEMGAMRMPFFGSDIPAQNSILEHYLVAEPGPRHSATLTPFPNPGQTPGDPGTGIYLNRGLGPRNDFDKPTLIRWPQGGEPDHEDIVEVKTGVEDFVTRFTALAKGLYTDPSRDWEAFWGKVVDRYDALTFNDLVRLEAREMDRDTGDLGGFDMSQKQAELLYTIGIGDGSWGAFYNISALWFMRCALFGFSSHLMTVEGLRNMSTPLAGGDDAPRDRAGHPLAVPRFEGIQALVEYLYYGKPSEAEPSLHEKQALWVRTPVRRIRKADADQVEVTVAVRGGREVAYTFDFALVTSSTWASQLSFDFVGFSEDELPQQKLTAMATQHSISSCKLFFPLTEKFWERQDNRIPQVIITDTFIQDVYAMDWTTKPRGQGILLASYTWEDDSLKLLPFDVPTLSKKVLDKLSEITLETTGQDITRYVVGGLPVFIQWIEEPTYHGCSKLYRAHTEATNALDLAYNQEYAGTSKLYFAGENYGVEGGWTEPALRSAIDAVMQLLHHEGGTFRVDGFDFGRDYPTWKAPATPAYTFPGT